MAISIQKAVKAENRYKEFLKVVSAFHNLQLSDREIEVLDEVFWEGDGILSTQVRQQAADKLKITEFNLNNQIMKLTKKKLIVEGTNGVKTILPALMPSLEIDKPDLAVLFVMKSKV